MSLSESGRHSREFMLKAMKRLEAGERASALTIKLNLQRTIIYHWRDRFRAHGAEGLTSKRGRPRTPEVLAAEGLRASRARTDRYSAGSLIITSQVPIDHWYEIVGNPTLADAILDRIITTRIGSNSGERVDADPFAADSRNPRTREYR